MPCHDMEHLLIAQVHSSSDHAKTLMSLGGLNNSCKKILKTKPTLCKPRPFWLFNNLRFSIISAWFLLICIYFKSKIFDFDSFLFGIPYSCIKSAQSCPLNWDRLSPYKVFIFEMGRCKQANVWKRARESIINGRAKPLESFSQRNSWWRKCGFQFVNIFAIWAAIVGPFLLESWFGKYCGKIQNCYSWLNFPF